MTKIRRLVFEKPDVQDPKQVPEYAFRTVKDERQTARLGTPDKSVAVIRAIRARFETALHALNALEHLTTEDKRVPHILDAWQKVGHGHSDPLAWAETAFREAVAAVGVPAGFTPRELRDMFVLNSAIVQNRAFHPKEEVEPSVASVDSGAEAVA